MSEPRPVVIVTGAAQGIGECVAATLARQRNRVVVADIQGERAHVVAAQLCDQQCEAVGIQVDVADRAAGQAMVDEAISHFGRVDGLVNNGGLDAQYADALEIDDAHWRRLLDVDLTGQWWCTQAVLPHMVARGSGRIVYISSSSVFVGGQVSVAYCAAKSGLIGLTVGLSSQLEKYGILVNCVMPGPTGTGTPMDESDAAAYLTAHPLGFGGAQPIADAVSYLIGPSGNWTSGAILNVTGGRLRGR